MKKSQKYSCNMSLDKFKWLSSWELSFLKTLHLKMIHCCEAPRSMLFNLVCKKQVLRGTIWEIWCIQIQMYPKSYVEVKKNGACNLRKEVSTHRIGLVVNLRSRVAPPSLKMVKIGGKESNTVQNDWKWSNTIENVQKLL